jgi:8-oxo-dGTP pyrophosphatase MutT (NUDIX family)
MTSNLSQLTTTDPNTLQVAIAILYRQGQFLMQLRDDIPGIAYPGYWGFFGGHIEPDESPDVALRRELLEEIGYVTSEVNLFGYYPDPGVFRHVFAAPLTVEPDTLVLTEGWDLGMFTPDDIQRGKRYSQRAGQVQPIAPPHQRILLDFLNQEAHLRQV